MEKHKVSLWFYKKQGVVSNEEYMQHTKKLAINLVMTPPYHPETPSPLQFPISEMTKARNVSA